MPKGAYRDPVLVSSADGVGTKLKIAALAGKHDTVGIDAVAMNVNDILCTGARPLFFLDYIAFSRLPEAVRVDIVKGITDGCRESGCALIGGETAQMPDMYADGDYDIAGFCVGVVEKKKIINGSRIKPGQVVIGLASSGIHSNGYSLVRKVLTARQMKDMSAELLTPTRIYVKPVLDLLLVTGDRRLATISGIAHITGGAFYDKISRILPGSVDVVIRKGSWQAPGIFALIQEQGNIEDAEIFRTLNMGIGMVLMADKKSLAGIQARLRKHRLESWAIGEVVKGAGRVDIQ
jgi:phosphoribosylformylglycinamidine cyclo-ligase